MRYELRSDRRPLRCLAGVLVSSVVALASACSTRVGSGVPDRIKCTNGSHCPAGWMCIAGFCEQPCNVDDDCASELGCFDGSCQHGELPSGCTGEDCCNTASDCGPSFSSASVCTVLGSSTTCQGTRQEAVCVENVCASKTVNDDRGCAGQRRSCPNNLRAIACNAEANQPVAVCPSVCATDKDCVEGYTCDGSACVMIFGVGTPCSVGTPCPSSGLKCENGVCCAAGASRCCATSSACDGGLRCDTPVAACVTSCTNYEDTDCADPAEVCIADECVEKVPDGGSCTVSAECASDNCDNGTCCTGACAGCTGTPWGPMAHGASNTAYESSAPAGPCVSETRTCTNGTLSGSYTVTTCTAGCILPWGEEIMHGQDATAYVSTSVPCGSNCSSQTRTCTNGTLSGNYTSQSCSAPCAGCTASAVCCASNCVAVDVTTTHGSALSVDVGGSWVGANCWDGDWLLYYDGCGQGHVVP